MWGENIDGVGIRMVGVDGWEHRKRSQDVQVSRTEGSMHDTNLKLDVTHKEPSSVSKSWSLSLGKVQGLEYPIARGSPK